MIDKQERKEITKTMKETERLRTKERDKNALWSIPEHEKVCGGVFLYNAEYKCYVCLLCQKHIKSPF